MEGVDRICMRLVGFVIDETGKMDNRMPSPVLLFLFAVLGYIEYITPYKQGRLGAHLRDNALLSFSA